MHGERSLREGGVEMAEHQGWRSLFDSAFRGSRNAMLLVDGQRRIVDANGAFVKQSGYKRDQIVGRPTWDFVAGGPLLTPEQWAKDFAKNQFTGEASLICRDGTPVTIVWGATAEVVTGHRLVLFVAMTTSRWGRRFRREIEEDAASGALSEREAQIVHLVALGATGPEIADELHIAHDTVRTHVRNAMTKLSARSRAHLVAKALGEGHILSSKGEIAQPRYR
jgi:PAS domain S-box-containing protein